MTSEIYRRLLRYIKDPPTHDGEWTLLESRPAWEKSETYRAILAWLWGCGQDWKLIVVNYSMIRAQASVWLPEFLGRKYFIQFRDALTDKAYDRTGDELFKKGLYVDLQPWQAHLFDFKA